MDNEELKKAYEHHKKVYDEMKKVPTFHLKVVKNEENLNKVTSHFKESLDILIDSVHSAIEHTMYGYLTSTNSMIAEAYLTNPDDEETRNAAILEVKKNLYKNSAFFMESAQHMVATLNFIVSGNTDTAFFTIDDVAKDDNGEFKDTVVYFCKNGDKSEVVRFVFAEEIDPDINKVITLSNPIANKLNSLSVSTITYLGNMFRLKSKYDDILEKGKSDIVSNIGYDIENAYYNIGMLVCPAIQKLMPIRNPLRLFLSEDIYAEYLGDQPATKLIKLADAISKEFAGDPTDIDAILEEMRPE